MTTEACKAYVAQQRKCADRVRMVLEEALCTREPDGTLKVTQPPLGEDDDGTDYQDWLLDTAAKLVQANVERDNWVSELVWLCGEDIFTDAHEYRQRTKRAFNLAHAIQYGSDPEPMPEETEA